MTELDEAELIELVRDLPPGVGAATYKIGKANLIKLRGGPDGTEKPDEEVDKVSEQDGVARTVDFVGALLSGKKALLRGGVVTPFGC